MSGNYDVLLFVSSCTCDIQGDTKKRKLLKNPTKIEEIQEKKFIDIQPLQLAFQETVIQIINV